MNFKKIFLAILAVSFIFTSCKESSDLSDSIPADALYVLHVDAKSLIEKSQYDIFKNAAVQQGINMYKVFLKDEDQIKLIDEFLKDANSLGIDIKNEAYVFTNYNTYGLVLGVNDSKKLKDSLIKLSLVSEENIKSDGKIFTISPESLYAMSWDDKKLVLVADLAGAYGIANNDSPVDIKEVSKLFLKQGSDKGINSDKAFAEFKKNRKDISVFYSMKAITSLSTSPAFVMPEMMGLSESFKSMLKDLEGISMGMYSSFEKGEITVTSNYYYDTPEAEKKYKELVAKMSQTLKGDHLKYIAADPIFMAAVNIKGEGVYDYVNQLGVLKMMSQELGGDSIVLEKIEKLVKNINGDITFALTSIKNEKVKVSEIDSYSQEKYEYEYDRTMPECAFFAEVGDPEATLTLIKELLNENGGKYKEVTPSVLSVEADGKILYFGMNNNTFFATNAESIYNNLNSTASNNNYSDLITGNMSFVYGDIQTVKSLLEAEKSMKPALLLFNELGKYQLTVSAEDYSGKGKLDIATKDKNSLAVLCDRIDQTIADLASSFAF